MSEPPDGRQLACCTEPSASHRLDAAILRTVAYADIFDYPLTLQELHRFLVGVSVPLSAVQDVLRDELLARQRLIQVHGYLTLPGRASIVEVRLRRESASARLWRKGLRYGLALASLPFVRMVAVTGNLAVNNADRGADIDYLVVTAPHRVWLARSCCLAFVYVGRLEGVELCPNYVISVDDLQFERSFFTAHELAQMVPIYGLEVYHQLLAANAWARPFLPNAFPVPPATVQGRIWGIARPPKRCAEWALSGRLGDWWERRESQAKIRRLSALARDSGTCAASFTAERCKGHLQDHGRTIRHAYAQRLRQAGLQGDESSFSQAGPSSLYGPCAGPG